MLEEKQVDKIAAAVARKTLGKEFVRAKSEPTVDSMGRDAWEIFLVIRPGAADRISGDAALDTLSGIQEMLQEHGEEGFGIVRYATEEELAEVDDT